MPLHAGTGKSKNTGILPAFRKMQSPLQDDVGVSWEKEMSLLVATKPVPEKRAPLTVVLESVAKNTVEGISLLSWRFTLYAEYTGLLSRNLT